jgi:hypothetical protein
MSLLRRRAEPEFSNVGHPTSDATYLGIEDAILPLPRIAYEDWELLLALKVVELWLKVRPGVRFGPLARDFAEAPADDRAAAHEIFVRQGLLFLHSGDLPAEFLIVKTGGSPSALIAPMVTYRSYYGHGDGSYRPLCACETLKDALMELWALQQARAPLRKPALVG